MIIGSITENKEIEKRISITPEIAKKYVNLGFEIQLSENYGKHLGFEEKEYTELGVKFVNDDKKLNDYFCLALNFGFFLFIIYTLPLLLTNLELRSLFFNDFFCHRF